LIGDVVRCSPPGQTPHVSFIPPLGIPFMWPSEGESATILPLGSDRHESFCNSAHRGDTMANNIITLSEALQGTPRFTHCFLVKKERSRKLVGKAASGMAIDDSASRFPVGIRDRHGSKRQL
jgi:hypothetical protein